jgi:hypothetical protein
MTIPTRNVRGAFAQHCLRFHHEILEDFVERRAHVHVAVGKRRTIMQNKQLASLSRLLNLLVKLRLFPSPEHFRLARGEVRLHRKIRARQVQCVFVVPAHGERATLTFVNWQGNVAVNAREIRRCCGGCLASSGNDYGSRISGERRIGLHQTMSASLPGITEPVANRRC